MIPVVSTFEDNFASDLSKAVVPNFTGEEIFHIVDYFSEQYLNQIINTRGRPRAVLNDHFLLLDSSCIQNLDYIGLPLWTMKECKEWTHSDFDDTQNLTADYAFNFMINKKQCSRYLLLKLVDIGQYKDFQYTWSGIGQSFDLSAVLREINSLPENHPCTQPAFRSGILSPVALPPRFMSSLAHNDNNVCKYYESNKWAWDSFLKNMFDKSCVSLISETGGYEKGAGVTEKTLFSVFGLTFPIWVGNFGQAQTWKNIGFDVFDDVIDHSYQWHPTLIERCYWAFELNKKILSDLDYANTQRFLHKDRLLKNRHLALDDKLGKYCEDLINNLPQHYQDPVSAVKKRYYDSKK